MESSSGAASNVPELPTGPAPDDSISAPAAMDREGDVEAAVSASVVDTNPASSALSTPTNSPKSAYSPLRPMKTGRIPRSLSNTAYSATKKRWFSEQFLVHAIMCLHVIEFICMPKYIIMPLTLLYSVGGPIVLACPWSAWAFVGNACQVLFFRARQNTVFEPRVFDSLHYLLQGAISRLTCRRYEVAESRESHAGAYLALNPSDFEIVGTCVWSGIDIILSAITAAIGIFCIIVIFTESDGLLATGWQYAYQNMIALVIICLFSILVRVCLICCMLALRYKVLHNRQHTLVREDPFPEGKFYLQKRSPWFLYKSVGCVVCMVPMFVGFVYTVYVFTDYSVGRSRNVYRKRAHFSGCDPMLPGMCGLPFPSQVWMNTDPSTASGWRVAIPPSILPYTRRRLQLSGSFMNRFDGFSVSGALLWRLPGVQESQLVSYKSVSQSVLFNSTTLLIALDDFGNGKLHPHFTEIDHLYSGADKLSYILPASSLKYNTSYVVLVKGLTDSDLHPLAPTAVWTRYVHTYNTKTEYTSSVPQDVLRYRRFAKNLFPLLARWNISLDAIQLAWDFRTASMSSLLQTATAVQANTVNTLAKHADSTFYSKVDDESSQSYDCSNTALPYRVAYYRINTPWFLQSTDRIGNYLREELLQANRSDVPMNGNVGLLVVIPCSVGQGKIPTALVEFGHGIFGSRSDAMDKYLVKEAHDNGWIMYAMDWRGFSSSDLPISARLLLFDSETTVEQLSASVTQGFASKLAGRAIVRSILNNDRSNLGIVAGIPLTESALPSRYLGVSMGGILGGGYTAFARYTSAVFLVSGSPFTFVLARSDLFTFYLLFADLQFYNRKDLRLALTSWQILLDAAESTGWAHSGRYDSMTTLLQVGLGDSTVTTIASRVMAANLNSSQLLPTPFPAFGVPGLYKNSTVGIDIFFEGIYPRDQASLPTNSSVPQKGTGVHNCVPQQPEVIKQNSLFITKNVVTPPCGNKVCVLSSAANGCS